MPVAKTDVMNTPKEHERSLYYIIEESFNKKEKKVVTKVFQNEKGEENLILEYEIPLNHFLIHIDNILSQIEGSKSKVAFPVKKKKKRKRKKTK